MELVHIIESVLSIYYQTFAQKNWEILPTFLSDDFTYFSDKCFSTDKSGFLQTMSQSDWTIHSCNISNLSIIPSSSSDIVIAMYNIEFKGISNSVDAQFSALETCVFRHNDGNWKLAHCHTSNSH